MDPKKIDFLQSVQDEPYQQKACDELSHIPVSQFMTKSVVKIRETANIRTASKILIEKKVTGIPVVNDKDELIGVVSEKDLLLQAASGSLSRPIQFCSTPEFFKPDTPFKQAIITMIRDKRKWVPVINDHKKIVGIVARYDLLKVLFEKDTGE